MFLNVGGTRASQTRQKKSLLVLGQPEISRITKAQRNSNSLFKRREQQMVKADRREQGAVEQHVYNSEKDLISIVDWHTQSNEASNSKVLGDSREMLYYKKEKKLERTRTRGHDIRKTQDAALQSDRKKAEEE